MYPGDDRLRQFDDTRHQGAALVEQGIIGRAARIGADFLQVMAGAEGRAGGANDHDTNILVGTNFLQFALQRCHQPDGEAVAGAWPIEC